MALLTPQVDCPNVSSNKSRVPYFYSVTLPPNHRQDVSSNQIYSPKNVALGLPNSSELLLGIWVGQGWKARSGDAKILLMLVKAEQTSVQRRRACGLPVKPGEGSSQPWWRPGEQERLAGCWRLSWYVLKSSSCKLSLSCPWAPGMLHSAPFPPLSSSEWVYASCTPPKSLSFSPLRKKMKREVWEQWKLRLKSFFSERDDIKLTFPDGPNAGSFMLRSSASKKTAQPHSWRSLKRDTHGDLAVMRLRPCEQSPGP